MGEASTAIGNQATAYSATSTALGNGSVANGESASAIGHSAGAWGAYGTAIGESSSASEHSTAVGSGAVASGVSGTALGNNSHAYGEYSTSIGKDSEAWGENSAAIGSASKATAANSVAIGADSIADRANSVSFGNATLKRQLTNIADGGVYQGSSDAVTGNQLWDTYQRMGTMENNIYREMDNLREDINIVGAHAAALSGLHPIQYDPDEPTTLSAAVGTYRDEYAVAVGVFHYTRRNVMFNLGASICSDGDLMGRAGVSFAIGKGGKKDEEKPKDMAGMQKRMDEMQAMLEKLMEENEQNKQTIVELTSLLEEKN